MENKQPRKLSISEKWSLLGKCTDGEMMYMSVIIAKSASGEWSRVNDFSDKNSPDKRLNSLSTKFAVVRSRRVKDIDVAGRPCLVTEYCV